MIELIWKLKDLIIFRKKNSYLIKEHIKKSVSSFDKEGITLIPLNKYLKKTIYDIRNTLIQKISNLENLTDIDQSKLIDFRPKYKRYRVDLTTFINPISIIKVLSSNDIFSFLKSIYPDKKPSVNYLSIWLDGVNYNSFKLPTETRLFHRDGNLQNKKYAVKFFVLLSKVDQDSGPFTYIKGSHKKESQKFDSLLVDANDKWPRFTHKSVVDVYGKKNLFYLTGDPGTSTFVDTFNGLHKGSMQASGNTRVMLSVCFGFK